MTNAIASPTMIQIRISEANRTKNLFRLSCNIISTSIMLCVHCFQQPDTTKTKYQIKIDIVADFFLELFQSNVIAFMKSQRIGYTYYCCIKCFEEVVILFLSSCFINNWFGIVFDNLKRYSYTSGNTLIGFSFILSLAN